MDASSAGLETKDTPTLPTPFSKYQQNVDGVPLTSNNLFWKLRPPLYFCISKMFSSLE